MSRRQWSVVASCLLLLPLTAACKKQSADPKASATPTVSAKKKPAVLVGSVRLADGAELPSYSQEQMERQVLAHAKGGTTPDVCSPPKIADRQPVSLTPDGKLIGVMLAASDFTQREEGVQPKIINVGIKDCRLTPKLVVARIGDTIHIENGSPYPMMPGMGFEAYNSTLIEGQSRDIKLEQGGVKILACGFSAQCGRTDVVVLGHTQGVVTNAKGEFRFENFPADETVRLNAWHPLFNDTTLEVRVESGEEKRVELVLAPRPAPRAPTPVVKDPKNPSPD